MRDVVRTFCIFSFLSYLDTLFLYFRSGDHLVIAKLVFIWYIYIWWGCYYILSPISLCVVSFLSLCTCFLFIVCNLLFLFRTKMLWLVLFKVFQKYWMSNSMPWTLFLQSFSRVCVRIDFIVFNKWIWVEWFMTCLIFYLFVMVLSQISK